MTPPCAQPTPRGRLLSRTRSAPSRSRRRRLKGMDPSTAAPPGATTPGGARSGASLVKYHDRVRAILASYLDPTAKLVLIALADHANDDGDCFPSQRRLAAMTGLTDRGVRGVLSRLTEAVTVVHRTGRPTLYRLHLTSMTPERPSGVDTSTPERPSGVPRNLLPVTPEPPSAEAVQERSRRTDLDTCTHFGVQTHQPLQQDLRPLDHDTISRARNGAHRSPSGGAAIVPIELDALLHDSATAPPDTHPRGSPCPTTPAAPPSPTTRPADRTSATTQQGSHAIGAEPPATTASPSISGARPATLTSTRETTTTTTRTRTGPTTASDRPGEPDVAPRPRVAVSNPTGRRPGGDFDVDLESHQAGPGGRSESTDGAAGSRSMQVEPHPSPASSGPARRNGAHHSPSGGPTPINVAPIHVRRHTEVGSPDTIHEYVLPVLFADGGGPTADGANHPAIAPSAPVLESAPQAGVGGGLASSVRRRSAPSTTYAKAVDVWDAEYKRRYGSVYPWQFKGRDADGARVKSWLANARITESAPGEGLDRLHAAIRAYMDAVDAAEAFPRGDPPTTRRFSSEWSKWSMVASGRHDVHKDPVMARLAQYWSGELKVGEV